MAERRRFKLLKTLEQRTNMTVARWDSLTDKYAWRLDWPSWVRCPVANCTHLTAYDYDGCTDWRAASMIRHCFERLDEDPNNPHWLFVCPRNQARV
jgi:hypothetical protein